MGQPSSPKARRPKHVSPELVCEFDMFNDEAYVREPHARMAELAKSEPPVFWTPYNGGHWMVQGYDAAREVSTSPDVFSSEIVPHAWLRKIEAVQKGLRFVGIKTPRIPFPYPILLDPPTHTRYRRPLSSVFSPRNVRGLEDRFRQSAQVLLDRVADQGRCEFMSGIAEPLPVQLFLQLFGLPVERLPEYRALLKQHMQQTSHTTGKLAQLSTMTGIVDVMRETLLERKAHPKDDLISLLWETEIDGKGLGLADMENYGVLLFIAGLDTVVQSMGFAARHLAMHPALQQALREEPDRIPDAVEELLRCYGIASPPRRVLQSIDFHGARLAKNDILFEFLPGANLDPSKFEEPEKFDLDRRNKKEHMAFNIGPHFCLGAGLARLELRVLLEELLTRLPTFALDPAKPPTFHCGFIVGVESLDLVWGE